MDRYDIFVKQRPSFKVEDGMAHVGYQSGDLSFQVVMPMSVFTAAVADAREMHALWEAEQSGRFVQEFPVRNRARGDRGEPEDHAA